MSMVYNHWGVSIVRDCVCWSPGQLTRVGQLSRTGSTIGNEKQPPVPRLSYHATVEPPPPDVAETTNNMTHFEGYTTKHNISKVGRSKEI